MDALRLGSVVRTVRRRRGWRQIDVARAAGVGQTAVSCLERGRIEAMSVGLLLRIVTALEIRLDFQPRWRGGELDRLLDVRHAAVVERVVGILRASGWEVEIERSFNHFGERGAIDVLAWQPAARALLVGEVKSELVDLQDLVATLDRKVRIAAGLARRRPVALARIVFVADTRSNRRIVAAHPELFGAAFPGRTVAARGWVKRPSLSLAAIWFLTDIAGERAMRDRGGSRRVRGPRQGS
jgi:transcriptional regulator with XRE-family HTH domain